jgi:hypothetical protein
VPLRPASAAPYALQQQSQMKVGSSSIQNIHVLYCKLVEIKSTVQFLWCTRQLLYVLLPLTGFYLQLRAKRVSVYACNDCDTYRCSITDQRHKPSDQSLDDKWPPSNKTGCPLMSWGLPGVQLPKSSPHEHAALCRADLHANAMMHTSACSNHGACCARCRQYQTQTLADYVAVRLF